MHRRSRRFLQIGYYSIRQVILMLSNALIALAVIRKSSTTEWGLFVKTLIVITLIAHVASWGNRDYLLRQFSLNVGDRFNQFFASLWSRSVLLIPGMGLLFWLDSDIWVWNISWLVTYFTYQSYDVLIVYERRFREAAILDLVGLLWIIGPVLMTRAPDMLMLVQLYFSSYLLRTILLTILFREVRTNLVFRFQGYYFISAFPFFIIGLSGLLQSRIDLYTISFFLSDEEVGIYQILMGFLLAIQAGSAFILTPFAKNIMRSTIRTVKRLASSTSKLGILLVIIGIVSARFILSGVYQIELDPVFYVTGAFFALAPYFYLVRIYKLYGQKREKIVVTTNLMAALLNMILTLFLIQHYGIIGALIAASAVQWLVVLGYFIIGSKNTI